MTDRASEKQVELEMLGPVFAELRAEWAVDCDGTDVSFDEWLAFVTRLAGVPEAA
jgi:hypothetical protein